MRAVCRCLVLLLVACPIVAKAVTIRVQDPNYTNLTMTPTSFTFGACPSASSPGGAYLDNGAAISSDGCFGGLNQTQATITSITLTFQNTVPVQDSTQPDGASSDIFQNSSFVAPSDPTDPTAFYSFTFSGGALTQRQTFVITEDGVPYDQFPTVSLSFTTGVTPEPSSFLLLGTSLVCMGWMYRRYHCV